MNKGTIDLVAAEIGRNCCIGSRIIHTGGSTPIDDSRFRIVEQTSTTGNMSFIDGGNAPILVTPSQTCHLIRTAEVAFCNNKRTGTRRRTSIVMAASDGSEIRMKSFGEPTKIPHISLEDKHLKTGEHPVTLASALELARRLSEIHTAAMAAESISDGIVVIDGDLNAAHPSLMHGRSLLKESCTKAGAILIGCAKTNSACTETGCSAAEAIIRISPKGRWAYALDSNDGINRLLARLHPCARHCFMIESLNKIDDETISRLCAISGDLAFPGYPYGLIVADQMARVSNQERESVSIEILAKTARTNKGVITAINGSNAHAILDRMQF